MPKHVAATVQEAFVGFHVHINKMHSSRSNITLPSCSQCLPSPVDESSVPSQHWHPQGKTAHKTSNLRHIFIMDYSSYRYAQAEATLLYLIGNSAYLNHTCYQHR
jgi:hypothetical protein